jgi:nitroimidazol reductase NimA-like FMN-containing flavoprotein (pyridoxamine 5'-phosphate oxidase superfamily)
VAASAGCDDAVVDDLLTPTDRTTLRRKAERGHFDRPTVHAVLDAGQVCHVGVVVDGAPKVLPMAYGRVDEVLYLHGAVGNALLRAATGAEVCVTVTLVDALVLARSAFHHSMNYRSVVVLGVAERVTDLAEQRRAAAAIVDHAVPGRSEVARPPTDAELRATAILRLPIVEASAKVRTGGPIDDDEDLAYPAWAGVVPLRTATGEPEQDPTQSVTDLPAPTLR